MSAIDRHATIVETRFWPSEDAARASAAALAQSPAVGNACVTLHGDLGAGKTTWVRHLLQALGVQGRIKSPTYAVVEPYTLDQLDIWHFDFYRFSDAAEAEEAGLREHLASTGLKLVEWPERAAALLSHTDLDLAIHVMRDGRRQVRFSACTPCGAALLATQSPTAHGQEPP